MNVERLMLRQRAIAIALGLCLTASVTAADEMPNQRPRAWLGQPLRRTITWPRGLWLRPMT